MILCGQYLIVLATASEDEKNVWLKELNQARCVTHDALVQMAYFNLRAVETINDLKEKT